MAKLPLGCAHFSGNRPSSIRSLSLTLSSDLSLVPRTSCLAPCCIHPQAIQVLETVFNSLHRLGHPLLDPNPSSRRSYDSCSPPNSITYTGTQPILCSTIVTLEATPALTGWLLAFPRSILFSENFGNGGRATRAILRSPP